MKKESLFRANPEKASARIRINSFMMGCLFFTLAFIFSLSPQKYHAIVIAQLILAVPLLFVASLAYAKIGYWKETKMWDIFGWYTNNIGHIFILNAFGLMTATIFKNISFLYFGLTILLMLIYSAINVIYKPYTFGEKLYKFLFFLGVLFLGGILPLLLLKF